MTVSIGLCAVACISIIAAWQTENGARCLSFMVLAFIAIMGAVS